MKSPTFVKEGNKNRTIQSHLLKMAEQFTTNKKFRPDESSNQWNLLKGGDPKKIESWEFTNEAIKDLLRKHYNNQGNPFTVVKTDSIEDLGQYLKEKDYAIVHTSNGHVFSKRITNHFGKFPSRGRILIESNFSKKHSLIANSEVLVHSSAEGVFLGSVLFMEQNKIYDFLGIPPDSEPVLFPSHRRRFNNIQVEIDGMLLWESKETTFIAIFEVKSTSKKKPEWEGGFSFHQVKNTAKTVFARFSPERLKKIKIIPVYFRSEWSKKSHDWIARFDRFSPFDPNKNPEIISSMDICGLPRFNT